MLTKKQLKDVVIGSDSNLRDAMVSLKATGQRIVVIADDSKRVIGIATDGDIRSLLLESNSFSESILTAMTRDFVYVLEDFTREQILKLLDTRVHQIPVLDPLKRLVDIVGADYRPTEMQIISRARTPARISLAGGGTDFTSYFMDNGGAGLSCTIQKYSHAVLRKRHDKEIRIYSHDFRQRVELKHIDDIQYNGELDLIKAGIKLMKPTYGFDLELGCDFAPASGLGGSASLLASVIGCFNEFLEQPMDRYAIAEYAFEAERIELQIGGGWQDQYSTVFGGFNFLEFDRTHNTVMPLRLQQKQIQEIEERLILCNTNQSHLGEVIQKDNHAQNNNKKNNRKKISRRLKDITDQMKYSLLRGNYDDFGLLLTETWEIKKENDPRVTNANLDSIYEVAMKAGALGGRLLGTGGGGFFIFYVPPFSRYSVIESLESVGLQPETVIIDQNGLSTWKQ